MKVLKITPVVYITLEIARDKNISIFDGQNLVQRLQCDPLLKYCYRKTFKSICIRLKIQYTSFVYNL